MNQQNIYKDLISRMLLFSLRVLVPESQPVPKDWALSRESYKIQRSLGLDGHSCMAALFAFLQEVHILYRVCV